MTFKPFNVGLCLSAALVVTTVAGLAHAQTPQYSVEARAITGTMPGSGATYSGPFAGETATHALNDPPALQWTYNINQLLYSDAAAEGWTEIGSLSSHAHALAQRVQATNFPPGVTASTMGRYTDRLKVGSATLPVGAPVTLTFRSTMSVDWQGEGLFDGKASCQLQVGGPSVTSQWSAATDVAVSSVAAPLLVVKTTVGATLSLSARLDTFARGSFFLPGPRYDGQMEVNATCDAVLVAGAADVTLTAESGHDYAAP
jgi:hypothetical protein